MTLREQIVKDLINHEGKKRTVYLDSMGIETIGVGRNLRHVGLDDDEVLYLLNNDIDNRNIRLFYLSRRGQKLIEELSAFIMNKAVASFVTGLHL